MTEEELALFDILTKPEPKLEKSDRELVKTIAKELALYFIELLKRIVEGEQVSIGKMIQEYAISKHNPQLPEGTIRGLRVVRPEGAFPSPFQKMGLNSWMNNWLRIPKEKALMILDQIKERIDALSSMPSEPLPLEPSKFLKIEETVLEDMKSQDYEEESFEGGGKKRYSQYYERNPKLKAATVSCHGTSCMVCGFDFEETYGSHGAGFIEVHHLKPVSELTDQIQVDPIADMVVLCANCHRMIHHRRKHILSLDDLRKIRKV